MTVDQLSKLHGIFDQPLPGKSAHAVLANNLGRVDMEVSKNAREAAVMLLVFPDVSGELHIVFTERSTSDKRDRHSGQMSFPGGKKDPGDHSLEYTSLRETAEEIGVPPEKVSIIGKLTPLYIPVSNFIAHPYLGYVDHWPTFEKEEREVAKIVTSSLRYLVEYEVPSRTDIQVTSQILLKDIPYYDVDGHVVWGATSMMLSEFLTALRQVIA